MKKIFSGLILGLSIVIGGNCSVWADMPVYLESSINSAQYTYENDYNVVLNNQLYTLYNNKGNKILDNMTFIYPIGNGKFYVGCNTNPLPVERNENGELICEYTGVVDIKGNYTIPLTKNYLIYLGYGKFVEYNADEENFNKKECSYTVYNENGKPVNTKSEFCYIDPMDIDSKEAVLNTQNVKEKTVVLEALNNSLDYCCEDNWYLRQYNWNITRAQLYDIINSIFVRLNVKDFKFTNNENPFEDITNIEAKEILLKVGEENGIDKNIIEKCFYNGNEYYSVADALVTANNIYNEFKDKNMQKKGAYIHVTEKNTNQLIDENGNIVAEHNQISEMGDNLYFYHDTTANDYGMGGVIDIKGNKIVPEDAYSNFINYYVYNNTFTLKKADYFYIYNTKGELLKTVKYHLPWFDTDAFKGYKCVETSGSNVVIHEHTGDMVVQSYPTDDDYIYRLYSEKTAGMGYYDFKVIDNGEFVAYDKNDEMLCVLNSVGELKFKTDFKYVAWDMSFYSIDNGLYALERAKNTETKTYFNDNKIITLINNEGKVIVDKLEADSLDVDKVNRCVKGIKDWRSIEVKY